ncbi:MAG: Gfo/Idh/MocA family oxidoreductase [Planctomycetes bacterium]|nr:Gfo/Idh/MocA family oxidoreductase [Planctomycetota bacterium]
MAETKGVATRREFIKRAMATSLAAGSLSVLGAPAIGGEKRKFKVGLVGSGGRGTGALRDHLAAAEKLGVDIEVVGVADAFEDRTGGARGIGKIPPGRVFVGFDGYKKLLDTDIDIVLTAAPPNFRPVHLAAAIEAGKHVFMEKPVAVDPPGARKIMEAGEVAKKKGLCVVAGTQRRHQRNYRETARAVQEGAVGKIRGGSVYWCGGALWKRDRDASWSDAEYLVRNWVSFTEMSGDHIVEQHVHNLDIMNWYLGTHPIRALGFGMRARRKTGNQFDFHSVDFEFPEGVHIHSMCRQINGTDGGVYEHLVGEKDIAQNKKPSDPQVFPEGCPFDGNPYVQEHIDLLWGILKEDPINEAYNVATSTMTAIMGRIATYTGKRVEWKDLVEPGGAYYDLTLKPTALDFEKGEVVAPPDDVFPIPGRD